MALDLVGKRVLVMGLGRSGQAAARLALARGAQVHVTDQSTSVAEIAGTTARLGEHVASDFEDADVVVVSPGIPASSSWLTRARTHGATVIGELGFAAQVIQAAGVPMLAITGTNGKSSTTEFTAQLLRAAGRTVFAGGNLGRPLAELALGILQGDALPDAAVVEVSSYQLELPGGFHPRAAVVLNLTPDHLARHGTMAEYGATKLRIFDNMGPDDLAILPAGVPDLPVDAVHGPTLLGLAGGTGGAPGAVLDMDTVHITGTTDDGPVPLTGFALPGPHNRENIAAAVLLCIGAGLRRAELDVAAVHALPHRLEPVAESHGVRWVNDSKATNVDAALVGILGVGGPSIVLLGGQGKDGAAYASLLPALREHARWVICFGASGADIAASLPHPGTVRTRGGLTDAIDMARQRATTGDTVLLSPACASFDEFRDFEHRGEVFTALARREAA
jgi:UDP-N-acetylmuramoylalanine--D-glutamate ligase